MWARGLELPILRPPGRDVSSPLKTFSNIRFLGGLKVGSWAWAVHAAPTWPLCQQPVKNLQQHSIFRWAESGLGLPILRPPGRDVSSPYKNFSDIRFLGGLKVGSWAWAAHPSPTWA